MKGYPRSEIGRTRVLRFWIHAARVRVQPPSVSASVLTLPRKSKPSTRKRRAWTCRRLSRMQRASVISCRMPSCPRRRAARNPQSGCSGRARRHRERHRPGAGLRRRGLRARRPNNPPVPKKRHQGISPHTWDLANSRVYRDRAYRMQRLRL